MLTTPCPVQCVIHFVESGPVQPEFRGNINSVAIVVQPLNGPQRRQYERQLSEGGMNLSVLRRCLLFEWERTVSLLPCTDAATQAPDSPTQQRAGLRKGLGIVERGPGAGLVFPSSFGTSFTLLHSEGWRIGVFHRKRVRDFSPCTTAAVLQDAALREAVLCNAVNGTSAVLRSPPYSLSLTSVYAEETEKIVQRCARRSALREFLLCFCPPFVCWRKRDCS